MKPSHSDDMREFWDAKARENALYYVSSFREYGDEDPEEFRKWGRILAQRFLEESQIEFDGSETMLEIGCGVGRMTAHFAERFASVHALDVSAEMIERARRELSSATNVRFEVGNGRDLSPHADVSLDFVFSYIVLQHIPERAVALNYIREAARVLRPGGHLHLQFSNLPRPTGLGLRSRARGLLRGVRARLGRGGSDPGDGPTGLDHPAWVGSRLELAEVDAICSEARLTLLRRRGEGTQYCWITARKS